MNSKRTIRAYDYVTGKEESRNLEANDLLVTSLQPKSALVKVLFEPRSRITDTATYDITAWSIPYAWGLTAYATKERIGGGPANDTVKSTVNASKATPLGYAIAWNSFTGAKLLGKLLQQDIKVRYAEQPFAVDGKTFDRGTLIILRTSNNKFGETLSTRIMKAAEELGVQGTVTPVFSGFVDKGYDFGSPNVHIIKKARVALFTGEGVDANAAGELWHYFEQQLNYPVTLVNATSVGTFNWFGYDVVIMPDGNYRFLNDKSSQDLLKQWVNQGGKLIALESAVSQLAQLELGIRQKKDDDKKDDDSLKLYERLKQYDNRERDYLPNTIPGAVYKLELDNTHPLGIWFSGILLYTQVGR